MENVAITAGRSLLLRSLSDLFYYLRAPSVPTRFHDAVTGWIRELVSSFPLPFESRIPPGLLPEHVL